MDLHAVVGHFNSMAGDPKFAVLATVIDVQGSNYRLPGARMLIDGEGKSYGAVSGGCVEADLLARAMRVRKTGVAEVYVYDTSTEDLSVFGFNMGCSGVVRILLEPADRKFFDFLEHRLESRRGGVVATLISNDIERNNVFKVGTHLMIDERGLVASDFSGEMQNRLAADSIVALEARKSSIKAHDEGEFFIEYLAPPLPLIVFGAGHDAVPLIRFAKELGWRVTLVDHRPTAASRTEFAIADEIIVGRPQQAVSRLTIDAETVVVLMTHNYELDLELSELLLRSEACYVGMLGPRSRAAKLLRDLSRLGAQPTAQELERVYAPIGIDIGSETPEEIALSIVAEIRAVRAGRHGGMLRQRKGSIHDCAEDSERSSFSDVTRAPLTGTTSG